MSRKAGGTSGKLSTKMAIKKSWLETDHTFGSKFSKRQQKRGEVIESKIW